MYSCKGSGSLLYSAACKACAFDKLAAAVPALASIQLHFLVTSLQGSSVSELVQDAAAQLLFGLRW